MTAEENKSPLLSVRRNVVLEVDAFPFKDLKISDKWEQLESIKDRTVCGICKKSRKYFCYTCYVPVSEIQDIVPRLKLPVKIDIIKHAREIDGKSTAVHAAVLAPEDVRIFTYPCIPDYDPQENVVLIFPNKEAVSVDEVCENFFRKVCEPSCKRQCPETSRLVVHRAVFIDSTWNQSRGIFKDPRIKVLPSVVLKTRLSQFWRHQANSPRWYLATVEAIHQFLVELDAAQWRLSHRTVADKCINNVSNDRDSVEYSYDGQFDNILFFFRFMYSKIHTLYNHDQLKSYKRRLE